MTRTSLSRTETRALAVKAARGAGLDWGLAEEAGFATEALAARGIDGLSLLARWLSQHGASPLRCPITLGAELADLPPAGPLRLGKVAYPALLLPFLSRARLDLAETPAPDCPAAELTVHPLAAPQPQGPLRRVPTPAATLAALEALALRTTVPPSTRSREDAGAGTLDND